MNQLIVIDGVAVRQDQSGRYCLNDLHRAAGNESRHRPSEWLRNKQAQDLAHEISKAGIPALEVVKGGNNSGVFVCKELVYAYAMWISAAFNLKVIRTFDATQSFSQLMQNADKVQAGVILLESASKMLNLSNSSKLGAYQKLQQFAGLPNLMPSYAIDAPAEAADGSSRPTMALSTILKKHQISVRPAKAYQCLARLGIVERRTRPSTSAKALNGEKQFWTVTTKGLAFGKNITSPNNPRETQPHFFESKVSELIRLMVTASAA